jgi:2'-hydroxyisoflavone reductase
MDILVLGGTALLSRAVAEVAVHRGHTVTTFNRGRTGTPVPGATALTGDRTVAADLEQLRGREFDLAYDTATYPSWVRTATEVLEPTTGHYAFTSSVNAYRNWPEQLDYRSGGTWDGDPDAAGATMPDELDESQAYGWRKVGAERAAARVFGPDRTTVLRAGLITGPHDGIGRLPWWLARVAGGGRVLAPGDPQDEVRLIDARDIAEFALLRAPGTFEVTGPAHQVNRGQLFAELVEVTGSDGEPVWVDDGWLATRSVQGWTEIPLWIPATEAPGVFAADTAPAEAAGLACRRVRDTLLDTWAWMQTIEGGWRPSGRTPGLERAKENELLRAFTDRGPSG